MIRFGDPREPFAFLKVVSLRSQPHSFASRSVDNPDAKGVGCNCRASADGALANDGVSCEICNQ